MIKIYEKAPSPKPASNAPMMVNHRIQAMPSPMAIQMSRAFAQLALLGFSVLPNAQTNSMMMFTNGTIMIRYIRTHSLVVTTAAVVCC